METLSRLQQRWEHLVDQLKSLGPMRAGSLCQQTVYSPRKDGTRKPQGPYLIYTHKSKGKTVTRRLREARLAQTYRRQIANFRRFQQLTAELAVVGRQLAEREGSESADQKKTSRR